jgi:Luciferase-like monooxygenase
MRKVKVGYQLDFRNPPGSTLSFRDLYRESFAQVEAAEQLGFDSIWLTEHHFTDDGYLPALMPAAAAIAARTTRVTIAPTCCWRRFFTRSSWRRTPRSSTSSLVAGFGWE